jgi:hypothetical protein
VSRKQALIRYGISCTSTLAFLVSRRMRNKYLLLIGHLLYGVFITVAQTDKIKVFPLQIFVRV